VFHYSIFIGLAFWKAPRRKFYAVLQANLYASVEAESSDEEISPRSAKRIKTELKEELARVTTILQTAIPSST